MRFSFRAKTLCISRVPSCKHVCFSLVLVAALMAVELDPPDAELEAARPYNPESIRQTTNYAVPRVRHWRLEFYSLEHALDLPLAFRAHLRHCLPPTTNCGFFWVLYNRHGLPIWTQLAGDLAVERHYFSNSDF